MLPAVVITIALAAYIPAEPPCNGVMADGNMVRWDGQHWRDHWVINSRVTRPPGPPAWGGK